MSIGSLSSQDAQKHAAAVAALQHLPNGGILGVGTGSTVNFLINMLPELQLEAAVASSIATEKRLRALGIEVVELNQVSYLDAYVDGADEINPRLQMIKGGGAALTREKIVASVAKQFVCIADQSKYVEVLGKFPLPVEVLPMARSAIARKIVALGADPVYRQGVLTDNGNVILDVHGLSITDPLALEYEINQWPGVVCNGIFAQQVATVALIAANENVKTYYAQV